MEIFNTSIIEKTKEIKMSLSSIIFVIFFLFNFSFQKAYTHNHSEIQLNPENFKSAENNNEKTSKTGNYMVVSANKYATEAAIKILDQGGSAADAAVTLQLILGLVEPQSSGIGGGSFALYYDIKQKNIINYDGREKAPMKLSERVFLENSGQRMKFFDAVIGGRSVGVPGTLATLKELHQDFGNLEWEKIIYPVIQLAENGFYPPPRLVAALKKEKYLFNENTNDYFLNIKENPKKLTKNWDYAKTLKKISKNYKEFYEGNIAVDIVKKVLANKNPGYLSLNDLKNYKVEKKSPICVELKKFYFCGPAPPSSGGISIAQALIIYENFNFKKEISDLSKALEILNFVYLQRKNYLADPKFVKIDVEKLLNFRHLEKQFSQYLNKEMMTSSNVRQGEFSSTTHFSIADNFGNVVSMTSSIENGFGSRQYLNGFLLNNQLTDFSFLPEENGVKVINRPEGGKKPLSSMSPIIILNKNKEFISSVGSPGGTAIISYVFKTILDIFYKNIDPMQSISNGNFVKKNGRIYLEKEKFDNENVSKLFPEKKNKVVNINLVSGLGIIIKKKGNFYGFADIRRDGTANGK